MKLNIWQLLNEFQGETFPLYHYTSVDALTNGIIRDKELCLWATHNAYLNDPHELNYGESLLKMILKGLQVESLGLNSDDIQKYFDKLKEDTYITSFSTVGNNLPMWNMYGQNGRGVVLKFDMFNAVKGDCAVLKCHYRRDLSKLPMLITNIRATDKQAAFVATLPFMLKDDCYTYEEEYRLVGFFSACPTYYRVRNGVVIPYKEVSLPKDFLTEVIVGPTANQEMVKKSVERYLMDNGLGNVRVSISQIPYRII